MRVKIERDYNEYKQGDIVEVDERTARNLFKLHAASVDRMITKRDAGVTTKVVVEAEPTPAPKKSFIKRIFKR